MNNIAVRHCARYYGEEYRFIKIRSITYEEDNESQIIEDTRSAKEFNIIVKNIDLPSPDEIPLIHAIGVAARKLSEEGYRITLYEYEPTGKSVDRTEELKKLIRFIYSRKSPAIIVVPKLMSTVLASLSEEEDIKVYPITTVTVIRDLVFYLPSTFVPAIRFLVKRNSMASYRKYELMREHALAAGFNVTKEKLFGGNGEILSYLEDLVREGGITELLKNIPVTRLNLTIMAVLRCLGKNDLIKRVNITSGESETFIVAATHFDRDFKQYLIESMKTVFPLYIGSNSYPRVSEDNPLVERVIRGLENTAFDEITTLYQASVEPLT